MKALDDEELKVIYMEDDFQGLMIQSGLHDMLNVSWFIFQRGLNICQHVYYC